MVKDNIEGVLQQSTLSIYKEAKEWYPKAHQYAVDFSKNYNVDLSSVCAIISCLSPMKAWYHNLELTDEFLKSNGTYCRHMGVQVEKARRILHHNQLPEKKMSYTANIIGGQKTTNFWMNIYNPNDKSWVTIDSHICQAVTGNFNYKVAKGKQYTFIKTCIIEIAEEMKLIPQELQSVIWITWKNIKPKRIK